MHHTLNTLELMLKTAVEMEASHPMTAATATQIACDTSRSIIQSLTDDELVELKAELQIRKTWCAHILVHEVRGIVGTQIQTVQAVRAAAESARKLNEARLHSEAEVIE